MMVDGNDLSLQYMMIKRFEGCRLTPYLCPAGVWTCGWGSTGDDVVPGRRWSQEYADLRMKVDAHRFAKGTLKLCPNLRDHQLSAVADFAYNLGLGRLKNSTLRRRINAGDDAGASSEFGKWVFGGGKKLPGLVKRRAFNVFVFNL